MDGSKMTRARPLVALCDSHGVIKLTQEDIGEHGENGTEFCGHTICRIYDLAGASSIQEFINTTVWDYEEQKWARVEHRPEAPANWDSVQKVWIIDSARVADSIRVERNRRLVQSDWTQLGDVPLTDEQQAAWNDYRKQLRDLPNNLTGLERGVQEAAWPVIPTI